MKDSEARGIGAEMTCSFSAFKTVSSGQRIRGANAPPERSVPGQARMCLDVSVGLTLPVWPRNQVGGYLWYTGRDADVSVKAAHDPNPSFAQSPRCRR